MSRRWWLLLVAVAMIVSAIALVVLPGGGAAGPSSLARGSEGWLGARLWLESADVDVELLDRPLGAADPAGVLVMTFPAQRPISGVEAQSVGRWLVDGGIVVFAYSGQQPASTERALADALGLEFEEVRRWPSLRPATWWRWAGETTELRPVGRPDAPPAVLTAPAWAPIPPPSASVHHRAADGRALVFSHDAAGGRLFVLPAEALANGRLDQPGNQDLLATLATFGPRLQMDEYRHGLSGVEMASGNTFALDVLALHLLLCYLVGVVALARRFGPVWQTLPEVPGSTASFLLAIGRLHHRLGHHRAAARLLAERARYLDPALVVDPSGSEFDAPGLLGVARSIARRQRPGLAIRPEEK